jgi:ABC-type glycerol-3-phosphate transport system permease component
MAGLTAERTKLIRGAIFVVFVLLTISFMYPFAFMFINSFKTVPDYRTDPFALPQKWAVENYVAMFTGFKILQLFRNTLIVSVSTVALLITVGTFASYGLAKLPFRGREAVRLAMLSTMIIPTQVIMIPLYVMFSRAHLINNFLSVILAQLGTGISAVTFLMTSNFRTIPNELFEASIMDGAGYFNRVWNIVLPLGRPVIMLVIIFYFISSWNKLLLPMIFLQKLELRMIMPALAGLMDKYKRYPTYQLAGLFLSAIPAVTVYVVCQKFIIKGMTLGSFR